MGNRIKTLITIVLAVIVCATSTATIYANGDKKDASSEASVSDSVRVGSPTTKRTSKQNTTVKAKPKKKNKAIGSVRYINKDKVLVHDRAGKTAKVVKKLNKGKKVTIKDVQGNWYKIGKNKWVHKNHLCKKDPIKRYKGVALQYSKPYKITSNKLTERRGRLYYNGHKETWYSSKEYGQSQTAFYIPGKHLAEDGTYRDKDGYICIAANYLSKNAVIMTSLGPGKVYDRGGMRGAWIDIYTNWG